MKTITKTGCIIGLVAFSIGITFFLSWKREFALEFPIPENLDLTYGDIYMLNLFNERYQNNYGFSTRYNKIEKCYIKRLKRKGYINEDNHLLDPTLLDDIPDQTRYVGMAFRYGTIMIDARSFTYPWGEDLTKRGLYISSYYYGGGPPGRKIYQRTYKAKLAELAFDVC